MLTVLTFQYVNWLADAPLRVNDAVGAGAALAQIQQVNQRRDYPVGEGDVVLADMDAVVDRS
jgi:hypothetical protein